MLKLTVGSRTILVLIGTLCVGGAENHLLRVLPRLQSAGWKITVLPWWGRGELDAPLRASGVKVLDPWASSISQKYKVLRRSLGAILAFLQIGCTIFSHRKSIISFYLPQSYWFGAPIAILLSCRVLIMNRRSSNKYLSKMHSVFRIYETWLHTKMDMILTNSPAAVSELVSEGVPIERIGLVRNSVCLHDLEAAGDGRSAFRSAFGFPQECTVLVCVANLIPYKGHSDLIVALGRLRSRQDWRLVLVGADPLGLSRELIALAESHGINERVAFMGPQQDIIGILNASDIGILASHEEGLPNAVLEYMAAALPVVATSVGGVPDLIVDRETGVLIPPKKPSELAVALATLLDSTDMRRRLGWAGRRRVESEFGIEIEFNEYHQIYSELNRK